MLGFWDSVNHHAGVRGAGVRGTRGAGIPGVWGNGAWGYWGRWYQPASSSVARPPPSPVLPSSAGQRGSAGAGIQPWLLASAWPCDGRTAPGFHGMSQSRALLGWRPEGPEQGGELARGGGEGMEGGEGLRALAPSLGSSTAVQPRIGLVFGGPGAGPSQRPRCCCWGEIRKALFPGAVLESWFFSCWLFPAGKCPRGKATPPGPPKTPEALGGGQGVAPSWVPAPVWGWEEVGGVGRGIWGVGWNIWIWDTGVGCGMWLWDAGCRV